jgi:glycosyltransferase involved in cell wall biosynthesis
VYDCLIRSRFFFDVVAKVLLLMSAVNKSLVSIPLCTFNGERYLAAQLESLLAQTHTDIEILAFDDCSTDGSLDILHAYAHLDSRVKVRANQENLGFKKNFSQALALCPGEFIAPCDQDDVWLPKKLELQLASIGNKSLIFCDSELIDESGCSLEVRISDLASMRAPDDPVAFVITNCVSGHAMLFRRDLLGIALPIPNCFFYDWWLAAAATTCGGILFLDEVLVRYRQHGANVTDILGKANLKKASKPPGHRFNHYHEIGRRISALATLPSDSQAFLMELDRLWQARESQWVSIGLAWFLACNGRRLYVLQKENVSNFEIWRKSIKFSLGLRLKRLTHGYAYALSD